ncbi:MAG: methionine synthase [Bdellovibrionota bacterium]
MNTRKNVLLAALESKILILDGAMGTAIQKKNLTAKDFGGSELEGCNENLILTRPDVISEIHESYLIAGADIIETNTFGATPLVLDEYGLGGKTQEINVEAAKLARKLADRYSSKTPRFVAGSMGPTTKAISVTGGITFESLKDSFHAQALGLIEGGVDYLLLETCQDTRNIRAAILGINEAFKVTGKSIPIAVSITIEPTATMLAGQSVEALYASLAYIDLLYLGLNCATGPEFMTDHLRSLAKQSKFRLACVPNAGLPDEKGNYLETPDMIASVLVRFAQNGWLNIAGGCCGTHPGHIEALKLKLASIPPRKPADQKRSLLSGIDYLEVSDEARPIIVGERTNVIGSKKFKTLICEEKFDEASEVARSQIKRGAQIIDICLANPDRNELEDMRRFLEAAARGIRTPLMIDSTDPNVISLALTYSQGKAIINSINLEDGEERLSKVITLAKPFGPAYVVGTIDDDTIQGMGITRQRKLEIAKRAYKLLTEKFSIATHDIYWDPLVFPCATGDKQYTGSAVETIEAIKLLKQHCPGTKTILGISNVSFGLPPAGREILNSVFLYHCVQAGLDLAIVNAEKLKRYTTIPDNERELTENLLFNRGSDPIAAFAAYFREHVTKKIVSNVKLPLNERLQQHIIEGSKDGLISDLDEALSTMKPLEIINGPLMAGMDEVGRLFNSNKLIVAEVLQSAEVMKAAVTYLEPRLDKESTVNRGTVLLATVKGDVHDIGKNLVEIIFANNGFKIINLGIKIPPEQLIKAAREHKPDILGLSGLLVKSAQQMVVTAEDISRAGIDIPMLVGGAALSSTFVDNNIARAYSGTVIYARDAMGGLDLAKTIMDREKFKLLKDDLAAKRSKRTEPSHVTAVHHEATDKRAATVKILDDLPSPPDYERHVLSNTPIEQIWKYINPLMLYGRHLGIPGNVVRLLEKSMTKHNAIADIHLTDPKAAYIWDYVQAVKAEYAHTDVMRATAVYKFFRAESVNNKLFIFNENNSSTPAAVFDFPRQKKENGLCLSDYVSPSTGSGKPDTIATFVVTAGKGIRKLSEDIKNRGEYLKSHILQALAIESAEGYAEFLHSQIRRAWGFPDPPETTMLDRFQAKYHGKRYSFGYPACPRLDDQAILWQLLNPAEIGVQLTEAFMMDPESSVSALVFHHPSAVYFSVGRTGEVDDNNR